jgi:hypothetical protein
VVLDELTHQFLPNLTISSQLFSQAKQILPNDRAVTVRNRLWSSASCLFEFVFVLAIDITQLFTFHSRLDSIFILWCCLNEHCLKKASIDIENRESDRDTPIRPDKNTADMSLSVAQAMTSSVVSDVASAGQKKPSSKQRKWLREASMRRLSQLVKDKTVVIGSAQTLKLSLSNIDALETSGLSPIMITHLKNWVDGKSQ